MPLITNTPFKSVSYADLILATPGATVQGYWRCENEASLTMSDSSGNGRNLTRPSTGTDYVIGQVGGGIAWTSSGVSKQAQGPVTFANNECESAWTIEAWVNPTQFNVGIFFPILEVFDNGGASKFSLEIAQPISSSSDPFQIRVNNKGIVAATGNIGSLTGWQHIAATWTTTPSDIGKIYLNGSEVLSQTVSDNGNTQFDTIRAGGRQNSSTYYGGIDEVVLYDGVVSATDILAHYNAGI